MNKLNYWWGAMVKHRRAHVAAALGVATATGALTGSLLIGTSVRDSLRELVLQRLGATEYVLSGRGFFRATLADGLGTNARTCAMIWLEGSAWHVATGRRAAVQVYGVDASFAAFHGVKAGVAAGEEALLSPALAREFDALPGDAIALRVDGPHAIPRESFFGRQTADLTTLEVKLGQQVTPAALGDFSLRPGQGEVLAVFVPLPWLQAGLAVPGQVNRLLLGDVKDAARLAGLLRDGFTLGDAGLELTSGAGGEDPVLEHAGALLDDRTVARALIVGRAMGALTRPMLTYLVDAIQARGRSVPYSAVAGVDDATLAEIHLDRPLPPTKKTPILLNDWAALDLGAQPGDAVTLRYYVWVARGEWRLEKREFELAGVIPMQELAARERLAPDCPGITDRETMSGWSPGFPFDPARVRSRDEAYWKLYRARPKAWIPLESARKLWGSRFGSHTSVRFEQGDDLLRKALVAQLAPPALPFAIAPVRHSNLVAAAGTTDFGLRFFWCSLLAMTAGLTVTGLVFRMEKADREEEANALRARGFTDKSARRLGIWEAVVVLCGGAALGGLIAPLYAGLILHGLGSWWVGATGSALLRLHLDWDEVGAGVLVGAAAAGILIRMALRPWRGGTTVLAGRDWIAKVWQRVRMPAGVAAVLLPALLLATGQWEKLWPGRDLGGYSLYAESQAPLVYDPNCEAGVRALGLEGMERMRWSRFRLLPGDDMSRLNLYRPRTPRILGVPEDFPARSGFRFAESAGVSAGVRENPWRLLDSQLDSGTIPAIVDENSLSAVLHKKLGDELVIQPPGSPKLRLKLVAALAKSVFQSEVLISEKNFVRHFPQAQGWRVFLIEGPVERRAALQRALAGYGFEARPAADRMKAYARVEDAELAAFQWLGGMGLLLGAAGWAVLLKRYSLRRQLDPGALELERTNPVP